MKKIAVVGSGIAGLSSAYYLSRQHEVTVFEANDYIGGHTHTVDVEWQGEKSAIDTGFIVFNDRTYPNFIRLLDELGVARQETEMSFSVRNDNLRLEYNGNNLSSLFAQRGNLLSPKFWGMLKDILHFNRDVRLNSDPNLTIGDYLDQQSFGALFQDNYLLPMIAAIWSMGLEESRDFPLQFFVRFFENHGLLNVVDRPQWYSITGGSRSYIPEITKPYRDRIFLNTPVRAIVTTEDGVQVVTDAGKRDFDEVILACHADQALAMLDQPTSAQKSVLGQIGFTDNLVTLHTDNSRMPTNDRAWASWNYRMNPEQRAVATVTYNMNILQRLERKTTYLVTLNEEIRDDKIIQQFNYSHPAYSKEMIKAQSAWNTISGKDHIHFCGAYWFNGFHEDGVSSALRVCKVLGVEP